jgi:hypothetical protein
MMEKEKYTIEDLRIGRVGIALTKSRKRFEKIIKEAFPKDKFWAKYETLGSLCLGDENISYDPDNDGNFLWDFNKLSIPYVSEKDFVLSDDVEKVAWKSVERKFYEHFLRSEDVAYDVGALITFLKNNYKCKVKKVK